MSGGEDSGEKQYEPSQKKLDDARKKGEIPRSADLTTAAAYAGFVLAGLAVGGPALRGLGNTLQNFLGSVDQHAMDWFEGSASPLSARLFSDVLWDLLPFVVIPAVLALLTIFATRSMVFAPSRIEPKLSKISLISNAKNKFGRSGLFEFAKSFSKLTIYGIVLGVFLYGKLPLLMSMVGIGPGVATRMMVELTVEFMTLVVGIAIVIGGIDYLFQYFEHIRKHRMSRKDMTDESKEQEGDPHVKQQRRQKGYEIAMNQMLSDVPKADVVIVNPTHYAVALQWDRLRGGAPVCVAKGVDDVAARIREKAAESGVPIHSDPPTARALFATIDIGSEIAPEHYKAVAASIRFAEAIRQRAKKGFGGSK
ncbi:flagellar type III secretion system protein FlhB [Celeribacter arenosi]|uniref:EscU/YscU/HrcU family type III secretion system export apparatus switch protein n=1 Tax=Celeribacter arenosi TaxID=792649 RepID=A0ABP7JZ70_9RHOB